MGNCFQGTEIDGAARAVGRSTIGGYSLPLRSYRFGPQYRPRTTWTRRRGRAYSRSGRGSCPCDAARRGIGERVAVVSPANKETVATAPESFILRGEGWQNGYCTSLENWRPQGLGGSNPSPSVLAMDTVKYPPWSAVRSPVD